DGRHYHTVSGATTTSSAYQAGLTDGRGDRSRNLPFDPNNNRWGSSQERRDYEAGYQRGYEGYTNGNSARYSRATVDIGNDNQVRWQASSPSRVFVQVDSNRRQLFAEGQSGAQY